MEENKMKDCIFTVQTEDKDIIKHIRDLYMSGNKIHYDPTYSKGNFYKDTDEPVIKSDLNCKYNVDFTAKSEKIPLKENTIKSIMFDPPFLFIKTTKSTSPGSKNESQIAKRFSKYETQSDLEESYISSFTEFKRILVHKGILIVKCQDYLGGHKQFWAHVFVINELEKLGFRIIDIFIKHRTCGVIWNPLKIQRHARKNHSYYIVSRLF